MEKSQELSPPSPFVPMNDVSPPTQKPNQTKQNDPVQSKFDVWLKGVRSGKFSQYEKQLRNNNYYTFIIVLVTFYAVFADDVRLAMFPKSADTILDMFFFVCFAVFVVDIGLSLVFENGYGSSVIFLLDLVATTSMMLHPWLSKELGSSDARGLALARIARLVRIMRVMRVARFAMVSTDVALQKAEKKRTSAQNTEKRESFLSVKDDSLDDTDINKKQRRSSWTNHVVMKMSSMRMSEQVAAAARGNLATTSQDSNRSMIGTMLMQTTTEKIILLVLALVVGINLLNLSVPDQSIENGLHVLDHNFVYFEEKGCFTNGTYTSLCVESLCCDGWHELLDTFTTNLRFQDVRPTLRRLEVDGRVFFARDFDDLRTVEVRDYSTDNSRVVVDMSSATTIAALYAVGQSTLIMATLLVFPYLFGRDVLTLVVSPLEVIFDRVQSIAANPFAEFDDKERKGKSYELDMIKQSLSRLTRLLQVGLGHAGTDIIARNLRSGAFSVLQAGNRLDAIFGFCDIRFFTDCCEVLQEDCVIFVNTVAAVVADAVAHSKGAVNKNIGDAFLVVWKWNGSSPVQGSMPLNDSVEETAEASLKACIRIIRRVARSPKIQEYAQRRELRERLGPDFRISMGFGLHVGWAIEGAVGSEQKIDATYLSPTVNLAARLESGTRQYGVSLLMSHYFYNELTEETKRRCRRVDCVAVKGSADPMGLVAYQMGSDPEKVIERADVYYDLYIDGKWAECKDVLSQFLVDYPSDGPATAIWGFLERHAFQAPDDWQGFRKLTDK